MRVNDFDEEFNFKKKSSSNTLFIIKIVFIIFAIFAILSSVLFLSKMGSSDSYEIEEKGERYGNSEFIKYQGKISVAIPSGGRYILENVDINSFELISKAINKGVTIAIAFIIKTGLISTIIISSFISAVFATIRLILTSIAVKISLFIGKNNITKAEDLKTYIKVGFLVFLIMILILALDNLNLIIKNSIKNKKNRKYKENYLKLIRYICDNYDCLKNRGK